MNLDYELKLEKKIRELERSKESLQMLFFLCITIFAVTIGKYIGETKGLWIWLIGIGLLAWYGTNKDKS
jgi:hypothetical protein